MQKRPCPNCGYDNVDRAVFCFQCGTHLEDPPVVRGIHRNRRQIEQAIRVANKRKETLVPDLIEKLNEAGKSAEPASLTSPIVCLRCGTPCPSKSCYCIGCGASLLVPEGTRTVRLIARVGAKTSVGRVRDNNEDRIGLWARHGVVLAMVADGMGGAVAGEEASRLVTEAVQADFLGEARGSETLPDLSEDEIADKLRQAIWRGNRAVIEHASTRPEFQGMGTTVTLAFVRDNRALIAHVGDSRAYLVDGQEGWINQISDDHSFVEALLSSGHITPEQAAVHPMRNVLYRALGQMDETEADLYSRTLTEGDRLILCSDGLTRHVESAEIARVSMRSNSPDDIAVSLVEAANQRGGEDNISVVVIVFERAEDSEVETAPDAILFEDTETGLFQPGSTQLSPDVITQELPSVTTDDQPDHESS